MTLFCFLTFELPSVWSVWHRIELILTTSWHFCLVLIFLGPVFLYSRSDCFVDDTIGANEQRTYNRLCSKSLHFLNGLVAAGCVNSNTVAIDYGKNCRPFPLRFSHRIIEISLTNSAALSNSISPLPCVYCEALEIRGSWWMACDLISVIISAQLVDALNADLFV